MRGLDQISKSYPEAYEVSNKLYALIAPILEKYEARGSNGHHKAQKICQGVVEEMEEWILKQTRASDSGPTTVRIDPGPSDRTKYPWEK